MSGCLHGSFVLLHTRHVVNSNANVNNGAELCVLVFAAGVALLLFGFPLHYSINTQKTSKIIIISVQLQRAPTTGMYLSAVSSS